MSNQPIHSELMQQAHDTAIQHEYIQCLTSAIGRLADAVEG